MPSAWDITIVETLTLLDGEFSEFAQGLANDSYAVWLGAGISLSKVPGLVDVAEGVLEHLRARVDPANDNCRFKRSLDRIIGLVNLSADDRKEVDYAKPVAQWRDRERIAKSLTGVYARMLDQHPQGEPADYLVWDGIGVVARYADPASSPGPEHLGLAGLIMEGVVSDAVSANWDGLVEKAIALLAGAGPGVMQVRVLPDDVKDNTARARLYKFHGCAVLAGQDEAHYRDRLVGRASQIHGWADKAENKVIAAKLVDLAVSKSTLMLGLSTQDTNIQNVFVVAQGNLPSHFPTHPPSVILSEQDVGADQLSLLQNFYKLDYCGKAAEIEQGSLLRSYGQSLLPALWLHVLAAKLEALVAPAAAGLSEAAHKALRADLRSLRDATAFGVAVKDNEAFMLKALAWAGRSTSFFRDGKELEAARGVYTPLSINSVAKTLADPTVASSGLPQLALGLALIGRGKAAGHWTLSLGDPANAKAGAVKVAGPVRFAEIFFAANAQAAARLVTAGHASEDDDAIILHSHEVPPRAVRHPTAAPGRTLRRGRREFSLAELAQGEADLDRLMLRFKGEMAI
ncbi:hypothetical protein EFD56_15185 [Rhizobium phaseoli]|uniref:SIR2 family protein n=1 Tax=Rhizobium phaseoli TaxID=396 RepID=UPI000F86E03E|nr:SIR2 family protein [Rhizobium phaseoli]RUM18786.1 hypothetical protein EFD56_15185 [Rhizobium phaseoli]